MSFVLFEASHPENAASPPKKMQLLPLFKGSEPTIRKYPTPIALHWSMVQGLWSMVQGLWSMVYGDLLRTSTTLSLCTLPRVES
jgi:hypothetical protein